jgi:hypothetical protein
MRKRLEDPTAMHFIARAHLALEDAKIMAELVALSAETIGAHLQDLGKALKDVEERQEVATLRAGEPVELRQTQIAEEQKVRVSRHI